jgi:hypothetical protein
VVVGPPLILDAEFDAETVYVPLPTAVGVPEISQVDGIIFRPKGSEDAEHVTAAPRLLTTAGILISTPKTPFLDI